MLPKNLVLDEGVIPKNFDELVELVDSSYRVAHEQTTLEAIVLKPDGTVQTPQGEWRLTRDFLEQCADLIEMPLVYAYKVSSELFCENFAQRRADATTPVTVSRVGDVATGLIDDRKSRYRPACTGDVLRAIGRFPDLKLRRACVSYAGVDAGFVRLGSVVEPAVGDILELGIAVTNSESGGRQLKAAAYSYRLACTNGSIMSDQIGVARWLNDPRMTVAGSLSAFQKDAAALFEKLDSVAALYEANLDRHVPDVALMNLWRRIAYAVPRNEADAVLGISAEERREWQQAIREREADELPALTNRTAYEVHNRITFAAHGRSFRSRRGLEELGGDFLSRAAAWPTTATAN
jgi:hypothetical protein